MRSRFAKLFRWWPIGILCLVEAILFVANYKPGTFLMGWDNVMPEFNFKQALISNLFGVWQEHRGLGLYDGMGHAANLLHTILLWFMSLALPTNLLRYTFHFLMHLLGGVGAYVLLKKLVNNKTVALTGALFYMFNLATIQMFYTPLEAFSVHFAALPWLGWSLVTYLQEGSRKRFLIFLLVSFLSTPQFFIPTLLLPVTLLLVSLNITSLNNIKRIGIAAAGFLLVNAFWLLPYVYGLPHNAPVIQAAKINQMSSEEVFARNKAFGDLSNVLRLRGFPLEFEDIADDGTTTNLLAPWRMFLAYPLGTAGSWIIVGITLLGLVVLKKNAIGFLLTFLIGFLFLTNDTPVLREFTRVLQTHIPFFGEAFRFPFTKFSLLFAFSSTILFTIGLAKIAKTRIVTIIAIGLIIVLASPAFQGIFISDRLRVVLPDDYPRIFALMKDKPPGRVAYLPQQQYWSWKYYEWGYRGSGFTWYGLPQPILDRAFDPWSNENENYYWELSRSIYNKDAQSFSTVLNKYDVRYVLLDEHIISPSHNRALFTEEIKEMLDALPEVREVARFGKLTVYERLGDDSQSFISVKTNLPTVTPSYRWTDNDVAYGELDDYVINEIASPRSAGTRNDTWAYPFRSLFTKRSINDREFTVEETEASLILKPLDDLPSTSSAVIEKFSSLQFTSDSVPVLRAQDVQPCSILRDGTATAQNADQFLRFTSRNQRGCLSFSAGNLSHRDGYLVSIESRHITGRPMLFSLINQTAKHVELETYLERKTASGKRQTEDWQTDYFVLPPLAPDGLGYTVYLSNDAIGRQVTINDIKSIKFYRMPYQELVTLRSGLSLPLFNKTRPQGRALSVDHPNPSYYRITLNPIPQTLNSTLVLSQSFDPGWTAWEKKSTFPYVRQLKDHVLVNNWGNGWMLDKSQITKLNDQKSCVGHCDLDIVIFYLPQLLQWIGFALLPLPLLWVWYTKQ